ncbi:MAG: tRNA (adenosine(37)-N6)-threonylcarbamoyltransferase complex ATPase subunit type 1 TsaE [Clostridiales Family XIII bacterium]|jgi:tRNA threonylcarbamoyladenosine biosynthesis protein TsaE|nr:tRNA (adenosine(37)-N6)-threonylcarbamoyltransferase complex ATPase subunit type 1 TsaE [Clostridiales Family XIII bacterium]
MVLNERELTEYGVRLGGELAPGAVIALTGELGAGKTTLAKGIARGLGITDEITSPTFTLINEYTSGRLPLYHFDVYRLGESDEAVAGLEDLGYEEYFFSSGVTIVEWADLIETLLPENAIRITLSYGADADTREVSVS